jgi:hypothetical protein
LVIVAAALGFSQIRAIRVSQVDDAERFVRHAYLFGSPGMARRFEVAGMAAHGALIPCF